MKIRLAVGKAMHRGFRQVPPAAGEAFHEMGGVLVLAIDLAAVLAERELVEAVLGLLESRR